MFEFLASIFGWFLNFIYNFILNYGLAIILFSIAIKIILFPISLNQQKNMKKSAKLQQKVKELQDKYSNDQEKLNKEVMDLYKRENASPFSGCLSGILQIILLISVFYLVRSPLTFMKNINNDESLKNIVQEYKDEISKENNGNNSYYDEIAVISKIENEYNQVVKDIDNYEEYVERKKQEENNKEEIKTEENTENNNEENAEETVEVTEQKDSKEEKNEIIILSKEELENKKSNLEKLKINMNFLGLDLSKIPNQNLGNWQVYVIPVLYVITTFISLKLTSNMQKNALNKNKEENGGQGKDEMDAVLQANKSMNLLMPIMSVMISLAAPLGLALYWLTNNILMIVERLIINKFFNKSEEEL